MQQGCAYDDAQDERYSPQIGLTDDLPR